MDEFAKLFERDGVQVLVQMHEDDPGVCIKFRDASGSLYVKPVINFRLPQNTSKEDEEAATEAAWKKAEEMFNSVTEDRAFAHRDAILAELKLD